ncbi:MAG: IclR family transcriptional regulator [Salaquimonas sp.]
MSDEMTESRLPTNLRLLLILEKIGEVNAPVSPTEIAKMLNLPKQTAHRLCATLLEEGFVVRESPGKKLRPARRMREMATGILDASHDHIARHQILEAVARSVKETVNFVMPEEKGMSYKDRVETDWAFRVQLPVGTHVPFHCTASGKCFLASLKKSEREKFIEVLPMEKLTDNTISESEALLAELRQITKQGYAIDNEEFMDGMVAIAVPVLDYRGRFSAALACHGPSMRLTMDNVLSKRDMLLDGADKLSKIMFNDNTN